METSPYPAPEPSPVTAQSRSHPRAMPAFIGSAGLSLETQARGHTAEDPRDTKDHAEGLGNIRVIRKVEEIFISRSRFLLCCNHK